MQETAIAEPPDHGPVISDVEYGRRMVALYEVLPSVPSRARVLELRRKELDILIDHRLGTRFPAERRQALWAVQVRLDRQRRFGFQVLVTWMLPRTYERDMQGLARRMTREFAKVLSEAELRRFLDVGKEYPPTAP